MFRLELCEPGHVAVTTLENAAPDFAKRWGEFVAAAEFGHIQQDFEHAAFASNSGWKAVFLVVQTDEGAILAGTLLLERRLPVVAIRVAALPCGPLWLPGQCSLVTTIFEAVENYCRRSGIVFCRYNIQCPLEQYETLGLPTPHQHRVSPQIWSYWNLPRPIARLSIRGTIEDVVQRLHRKTRYAYRMSQKAGLIIRHGTESDLPAVLGILKNRASDKQFHIRDADYFQSLFQAYPKERLALVVGLKDDTVIAFNLLVSLGRTVWALYGSLDHEYHKLFPMEAVEVASIEWAQQQGADCYDLGGTCTNWPPHEVDKGYGVWHYKKRLGATAVLMAPYCDIVLQPTLYRAAFVIENLALPTILEHGLGKLIVPYQRLTA